MAAKDSRIPYLDGLRAYSILLVLLGHTLYADRWLQSAWFLQPVLANELLGPRIFFVLSGFLITTLLLEEQKTTGRISIRSFYERRVARIFPVFYLYIAIVAIATAFHFIDVPLSSFFAASTFTWNLHPLWRHGGIPDNTLVLKHFWTLSIEEQFYLVWPSFLVFFGARWARRLAVACMAGLPLLRLATYFLLPHGDYVKLQFVLVQDMLMWGAWGAFLVQDGILVRLRSFKLRWTFPWISGLCLFVIGGDIWLHPRYGMEGYLLPSIQCFAALLLVFWLLSGKGGVLRRVLESWPFVQLGLLSYSLYIWQQPFTLWQGSPWMRFPLDILIPLAVAIASYRLVEVPLRKRIRKWFGQSRPARETNLPARSDAEETAVS